MSEGRKDETVSVPTADLAAVALLRVLAKDKNRTEALIHEVPAGSTTDFSKLVQKGGMTWEPAVTKTEKSGREMLTPLNTYDFRYGAWTVKEALSATSKDPKTGNLRILYPRFNDQGDFDPTKSEVLSFSQEQINSLSEALKIVGH